MVVEWVCDVGCEWFCWHCVGFGGWIEDSGRDGILNRGIAGRWMGFWRTDRREGCSCGMWRDAHLEMKAGG